MNVPMTSAPSPRVDFRSLHEVSIIVPVAAGDSCWIALLPDLAAAAEILLAGTTAPPAELPDAAARCGLRGTVQWLRTTPGRAAQMNHAARAAGGRFLWFLHADSRITPAAVAALDDALVRAPDALHYFDLAFLDDGPRGMALNAAGARFRARGLGLPFGDQGLCLGRELFAALGGYDESARYGEDHLLVWAARRRGVPLRCTGAALRTSARTYRERGWLRTTVRHLLLTARQAVPQGVLLLKDRVTRCLRRAEPLPCSSRPPDSRR